MDEWSRGLCWLRPLPREPRPAKKSRRKLQTRGFGMKPRVCVTHHQVTGKSSRVGHLLVTGKPGVFRAQHFTNLGFHVKTRGFGQLQLQNRSSQIDPTFFQGFGSLGGACRHIAPKEVLCNYIFKGKGHKKVWQVAVGPYRVARLLESCVVRELLG